MSEAQVAVEAAAYAALSAGVTLAKVFQDVPPGEKAPVCIIADITGDPIGGKGSVSEKGSVTVYSEVWERARSPLLHLQGEVKASLDGRTLEANGFMVTFVFDTSDARQADEKTYIGNSHFTTFATPV